MLEYIFSKVTGLKTCNVIKKGLQHRCFAVKFAKFLRARFRPWHDAQAIVRARAITRANQEKRGLGGR